MVKQTWDISESERLRILNLHENATKNHYLLGEQIVKVGEKEVDVEKVIDLGKQNYPAGYYSIDRLTGEGKKNLDSKLSELATFVKDNKDSEITIQIEVGESQVTNYDNEKGGVKLKPGQLAILRGTKLREYLTAYFQGLVKSGFLTKMPIIPEAQNNVQLGTQKHTYIKNEIDPATNKKYDPNDPKYSEDQYIKFKIIPKAKKKEDVFDCLVNLTIDVSYYHKKDPKFPCRGRHECNNAAFEIYLDSTLLGTANLNNLGCKAKLRENPEACDRSAKFTVTDEMVKKIINNPKWNQKTLILSTKCITAFCHTSVQEVKILNWEGKEIYHGCVNPMSARGNTSQKILAVLDKCGNPIEGSIDDNVSEEEMAKLADNVSVSSSEKIKEIVTTKGLVPRQEGSTINLLKLTKGITLLNLELDGDYLVATIKFDKGYTSRNFLEPIFGEKTYTYSFKQGDVGKIRYPVKKAKLRKNKIENLINSGYLEKVPNFNGYLTLYSIEDGRETYGVNTVLIPSE